MENLLSEAFSHVDVIGREVLEGHYDLMDPEGCLILPSVWEDTIQPGWEISMQMWPMVDSAPAPPIPPPPRPPPSWVDFISSANSGKHAGDELDPFMFPLDIAPLSKKKRGKKPLPPRPRRDSMDSLPPPRKTELKPSIPPMMKWMAGNPRPKPASVHIKSSRENADPFSEGLSIIDDGVELVGLEDQRRISPPLPPSPKIVAAQSQSDVPQAPTLEQHRDRVEYDPLPPLPPSPRHQAALGPLAESNRRQTNEMLPKEVGPEPSPPPKPGEQAGVVNVEAVDIPVAPRDRQRTRTDRTTGVVLPSRQLELSEIVTEDEHVDGDVKHKLSWRIQSIIAAIRHQIRSRGDSHVETDTDSDLESSLARRHKFSGIRSCLSHYHFQDLSPDH